MKIRNSLILTEISEFFPKEDLPPPTRPADRSEGVDLGPVEPATTFRYEALGAVGRYKPPGGR